MKLDYLRAAKINFEVDVIIDEAMGAFPEAVEVKIDHLLTDGIKHKAPYDFYSPIEDALHDAKDDEADIDRKAFLELLEIASWAVFRVLVGSLDVCKSENNGSVDIKSLDKSSIKELFLENLNCKEGESLLRRLRY